MTTYERILVTGGAGFVGSHLCAALETAYPKALRFCLMRPGETGAPNNFDALVGDLLDEATIERFIVDIRPDLVVHLAGQASIGQASKAAEQTWRVNFHGAFSLGAALVRYAPDAVMLFASSATVYGLSFRDGVLSEDKTPRPVESYGRSKLAAENALRDILGPEARLIIARPVNHSGPGQRSSDFVLASFAAQVARMEAGLEEPKLKVGDLSRVRDFLDVRDVVNAYMLLVASAHRLSERVAIFNVASSAGQSLRSIVDEFHLRAKIPFDIEVEPKRLRPVSTDIPSIVCDATKLRDATGWYPQYQIDDLIQGLLEENRCLIAQGER